MRISGLTNGALRARRLVKRAAPAGAAFGREPVLTYLGAAASINLGDVVLFDAIRSLLPGLHLVPNVPTSTMDRPVFHRYVEPLANRILRGGKPCRGILLGGGTLLNDRYFQSMLKRYARQELPLVIFGTGVESVELHGDRLGEVAAILSAADLIGVRDRNAQDSLARHGIASEVIGDPAIFVCQPAQRSQLSEKPCVGINLGCDRSGILASREAINDRMFSFIRWLFTQGFEVKLFAMHDHDLEDLHELANRLGIDIDRVWRRYESWPALLEEMAGYDLVVSQRLHGVILATASGIPAISIAYRPKCLHYMQSIQMDELCLRAEELDVDQLCDLFSQLISGYSDYSRHAVEHTNDLRNRLVAFSRQTMSVIADSN